MSATSFLALADLLPESMLLVETDGRITAVNGAAARLLASSARDLTGRSLKELVNGDARSLNEYLRACARSRQLLPGAFGLCAGDGSKLKLRADGAVYRPPSEGAPALVTLRLRPKDHAVDRFALLNRQIDDLNREIRRRRFAEEELDAQRRWLEVTLSSIGDAMIATDEDGQVLMMNEVAQTLTGRDLATCSGRRLEQIYSTIDETTRRPLPSPVNKVLADGKPVELGKHTLLIDRDGREIPIESTAAPIRDDRGQILGVILIFRDIGERRQAERERAEILVRERTARSRAEAADRTKDEFLATLSHELRAPLQAIGNWIYLLKSQALDSGTTARALDTIERNLRTQTQLVDDLLDVSHLVAGQVSLERESLELGPLVQEVVESFQTEIETKGIRVELSLTPGIDPISGDRERLRQVICNLFSNALKFSREDGTIAVGLEPIQDGVRLTMRDTGEGISAESMPFIFDRFRQVDASRTRLHGGLGLGLTIARHLAKLHGGVLEAQSSGPDQGATFTLTLPTPGREVEREPGVDRLVGRLVLLVSDELELLELVRAALTQARAAVMTAATADEALQGTAEVAPEVLICDLSCQIDCFDLLGALRERDAGYGRRAAAIALVAEDDERIAARILESGFDRVLIKPVEPQDLVRTIGGLLADPVAG